MPKDQDKSVYETIARDLRNRIDRGQYPPGSTLPHQETLADLYDVDRGTIKNAVKLLHAWGVVDPVALEGTYVRALKRVRLPADRYTKATVGKGAWEAACLEQDLVGSTVVAGVSWRPADRIIAAALEVKVGDQVCRRSSRSAVDGVVRQLQDTWFPERVARGTPLEMSGKLPRTTGAGIIYGALIAAGFTPMSAVEEVTSRMPTGEERELLGLRLGSPVLDARRTTRDATGLVLVHTHVVHSGDHVSLVYPQEL